MHSRCRSRETAPPHWRDAATVVCCSRLVLSCLSTCGFVSGNRARLSGRAASPSTRPLGVYIYAVGPRSCRIRRAQKGSARLRPETKPRLAPSGVRRGARGLGLSPAPCVAAPVVFAAIRAAMLRRWIHLLALRRVSPRIRRTASPHVAQFGTRPPSALADVPSARLTLSAYPPERSGVAEGELNAGRKSAAALSDLDTTDAIRPQSDPAISPRQIRRVEPTRHDYHSKLPQ